IFTARGMWPEAYSPAERTSIHWNSRGPPVLGTSSAAVMVFIGPECPLSMKSLDFAKRIQGRTNNIHIGGLWQVPQSAPTRAGNRGPSAPPHVPALHQHAAPLRMTGLGSCGLFLRAGLAVTAPGPLRAGGRLCLRRRRGRRRAL